MTILIVLVISVLVTSAACSMTEGAILSISLTRARILFEEKRKGSRDLLYIKENIHSAIATIIILDNCINIIGSVFVGHKVAELLGSRFLGIFSAVLTFVIIVFAEAIPKTIGEHYKASVSLAIAKALRFFMWILKPLLKCINIIMLPFSRQKPKPWVTEKEIKILLRMGKDAGTVELDEETLINRVFKLNDLVASQMMKPIDGMYAFDGDKTLLEEKDRIINSAYSRIAVYQKEPANIKGVCQQRVLLKEIANDNYSARVRDFMTQPIFVDENEKADSLLEKFRSYHQHLFIVRDKDKRNIGLITMEDVLEELFGEIYDEKDTKPKDQ